jgi:membrane protease YdiL (CAAX protease family)
VFLSVVILAPIFEEIIFRWGIFKLINKYVHTDLSIILSSLVFCIFHGSILQGIAVFGLAYSLNYIYSRTNNLLTCIFIHMCMNFFGFWTLFENNSQTENPLILFISQYKFITVASVSILAYFSYRGLRTTIRC